MNKITKTILFIVEVLAIAFIVDYFGYKGAIGVFIIMITFAIYRLIKGWDSFKMSMGYIESKIWGKPLQREFWDKGELKNTKVKVVWHDKEKDVKL